MSSLGGGSVSLLHMTDFINFIKRTKIGKDTILVTMDVSSSYTNIPLEEGIDLVCQTYDKFHNNNTHYPREMLGFILKENSFQFKGEDYLQKHGTVMEIKTAVSFANIFMAETENKLIHQSYSKPREWQRCIDDVLSLWDYSEKDVDHFTAQANKFHPSNEIIFLDIVVFKGERCTKESILDITSTL